MVGRMKGHYVKDNRGTARPVNHLFFDIESDLVKTSETVTEHRFKLGWTCYWRRRENGAKDTVEFEFFTSPEQFVDIIGSHARPKAPLLLVAHNVAYDAGVLGLFDMLADAGWPMTSFYAAGMSCIITFASSGRKLKIMDNGNYFKSSLAVLGDTLALPKLTINFASSPWEEMKAYCKRDVEIMLVAWQQYYAFLDAHDFGQWGHTIPSQAWNAWRHRFMDHKVLIHGDEGAYKLERAAYHGGRTSVFYKGKLTGQAYYYVDVNSMYPAMMKDRPYPTILKGIIAHPTLEQLVDAMAEYAVIAEVEVETDEPIYPVKYKGRNVYPVGRFWTTLTTPELDHALDQAMLRDIRCLVLYDCAPIFDSYIEYLYPLKVEYKSKGNAPYYLMTKLFLNSLYGRFGMKGHKWSIIENPDTQLADVNTFIDTATGQETNFYRFGDKRWRRDETGETSNSAPAVAAHVTAYARLYLWDLCQMAGPGHYLYCDTDSLIVDETGYRNLAKLMHPTKLGMIKVEQEADSVEISAPKFYQFGQAWKRKGVSKTADEIDPRTFEMDVFPSFLSQGHWPVGQRYTTKRVTKHFTCQISDGVRDEAGWIRPLKVEEMAGFQGNVILLPLDQILLGEQIRELKAMDRLPQSVMVQLWDYSKGDFKMARERNGLLVPFEYSKWDSLASDLGYKDSSDLREGVLKTLSLNDEISELRYELRLATEG